MKKRLKILFALFIVMLALAACAQNEPEEPAPTAEAAPTTEPATVAVPSPTAEAAATHDHAESAAPTAEPTAAAEAAPTTEPTATEPAAERFGLLRFRDGQGAAEGELVRSGSYQLLLQNVNPPPAGSHYELWLVDDSFNTLNLGQFAAEGSVDYSGSIAENLIAGYDSAFISIEPDGEDDGKIGERAFDGVIPPASLLHIRHVVTAFEANPEGKAFLLGAEEQLLLAIEHAGFLQEELAVDNIAEAQRHAEHVVNILDGASGASFGDLDGDGTAQNPGDGLGVRAYLEGAKQHAQLASEADGATAEVQLHAGHVQISADNMLGWLDAAIAEALRIIASDSAGEAQPAADTLSQLVELSYTGQDVDGDGAIAPIPEEGGWQTAYEHALNMGSFEFFDANAAEATQQEAPPAGPPPAATEAAGAPTATAAPAAAAVTIEMANFAFDPAEITVTAGTAVTWVNADSAPHTATASDGSFDTGILDPGQEATIVLDTPGTYLYYCTLHGSANGSGMAATITVAE